MKSKFSAPVANKTWSIVHFPLGMVPIRCKWVFKTKYHTSSEVERNKSRFVAKGYS